MRKYFFLLFAMSSQHLLAQAPYKADLTGTITKHNLDMDECKVSEMNIKYRLFTMLGEPEVTLNVEWQTSGKDPECLAKKTVYYIVTCHVNNPTGNAYLGELNMNAGSGGLIKNAGMGYGTDFASSPDYKSLFILSTSITGDGKQDIANLLNNGVSYLDETTARACWKSNLVVDGIYVVIDNGGLKIMVPDLNTSTSPTTGTNGMGNAAGPGGIASSSASQSSASGSNQIQSSGSGSGSPSGGYSSSVGSSYSGASGGYSSTQSSNNSTRNSQAARKVEITRKSNEIIDNYQRQQASVNAAGAAVSNGIGAIGNILLARQARKDAQEDAEREERAEEKRQARAAQTAQREQQEAEEQKKRDEERRKRDEEDAKFWQEQAAREAKLQQVMRAAAAETREKAKSIVPSSLWTLTNVKMPSQISDQAAKGVFYVIWNFDKSGNQIVISNPVEIKKSPDGDWPLSDDVYNRIAAETKLATGITPDGLGGNLGYLLGYFNNLDDATGALDKIRTNALSHDYLVNYSVAKKESTGLTESDVKTESKAKPETKQDFWKE